MPPSRARPEIEAAYRATSYRVGSDLVLRVGETSPALDELLARRDLGEWAYLTAHNPGSVALSDEENRARQSELLRRVAGYPVLLGEAVGDDGTWREASVLVLGIRPENALELAREFGQNAIICGTRGGVAELVWC